MERWESDDTVIGWLTAKNVFNRIKKEHERRQ